MQCKDSLTSSWAMICISDGQQIQLWRWEQSKSVKCVLAYQLLSWGQ